MRTIELIAGQTMGEVSGKETTLLLEDGTPFLCAKYVYKFCRLKTRVGDKWLVKLSEESLPEFIPTNIHFNNDGVFIEVMGYKKSLYQSLQRYLREWIGIHHFETAVKTVWVSFEKVS